MGIKRRSFIKIIAGITLAPLSFLDAAAAPSINDYVVCCADPTINFSVIRKTVKCRTRKLKTRWSVGAKEDAFESIMYRMPNG